jgi:hypothetical protein
LRVKLGRSIRRAATLVAFVVTMLAATAPLADAHGTAGQAPTNFRSVVTRITPAVRDVRVRITDLGEHVEVRSSGPTVIVLGYDGDPYLRIDDSGVARNERSPSTFLNRSSTMTQLAPDGYDAAAVPEWRRVSTASTARWHDHRIHPMGDEGDAERFTWSIDLEVDGTAVVVSGVVQPLDAPSVVPSIAVVVGAGALTFVGLRQARRTAFFATAFAGIVIVGSITAARWSASTEPASARLIATAAPAAAALLLVVALTRLARRGVVAAAPLLLFGFGAITLTVGFGLTPWLNHAELPASGAGSVWRSSIAVVLGSGIGAVWWSVRSLRGDQREPASAAMRRST